MKYMVRNGTDCPIEFTSDAGQRVAIMPGDMLQVETSGAIGDEELFGLKMVYDANDAIYVLVDDNSESGIDRWQAELHRRVGLWEERWWK